MSPFLLLVLHQVAPCPVPSIHPLEALQQAAQRDRELVNVLERTLGCRQGSGDCAAQVSQCTTTLAASAQADIGFDEAPYIADLESRYQGESFTASRIWTSLTSLQGTRCPASVLALRELLGRATEQQSHRGALAREYVAYVAWADAAAGRCADGPSLSSADLQARTASNALISAERERLLAAEARSLTAAAETARVTAEAWALEQKEAADQARARADAARKEQLSAEETARRERDAAAAATRAAAAADKSRAAAELESARSRDQAAASRKLADDAAKRQLSAEDRTAREKAATDDANRAASAALKSAEAAEAEALRQKEEAEAARRIAGDATEARRAAELVAAREKAAAEAATRTAEEALRGGG